MSATPYTAIYTRVSTNEQNLAVQREDLIATCAARRWTDVKEYADQGQSGAKTSRPALDVLLSDIKCGRVDRVVVWRFDRMARSTLHLLELLDLFTAHNVQFISIKESLDTSTAMGRAVMTILGAIAELERDTIRTRIKAGVDRAKEKGTKSGNPIGRPKCVFDRKLAAEMQRNGASFRAISKALRVPMAVVYRELKKATA